MENTEEKVFKDRIFWSGEDISSQFLSQYYADMLDEIKMENRLLGRFEEGKYYFSDEVKHALVSMHKKIQEVENDSYFIVSKTLNESLSFKMRVFKVSDGSLLAANLYLIEEINHPLFTKPLKTFIAQYVDKNDEEFLGKAKHAFNIDVEEEFLELDIEKNDRIIGSAFASRKGLNELAIETITKNFLEQLMDELASCGEEGKSIISEYKRLLSLRAEGAVIFYSKLKMQIDILLEKSGGLQKFVSQNEKIKDTIRIFNEQIAIQKSRARIVEISFNRQNMPGKQKTDIKEILKPKAPAPNKPQFAPSKPKPSKPAVTKPKIVTKKAVLKKVEAKKQVPHFSQKKLEGNQPPKPIPTILRPARLPKDLYEKMGGVGNNKKDKSIYNGIEEFLKFDMLTPNTNNEKDKSIYNGIEEFLKFDMLTPNTNNEKDRNSSKHTQNQTTINKKAVIENYRDY